MFLKGEEPEKVREWTNTFEQQLKIYAGVVA